MSLRRDALESACKRHKEMQQRVNMLFANSDNYRHLTNKVQMNHYGGLYLFGNKITDDMTDLEILSIADNTPPEEYDGHIDFFGGWRVDTCPDVVERARGVQRRVNALFAELGLELENKVTLTGSGKMYLFGKLIGVDITDDELVKVIKDTPEDTYDGFTNDEGTWITRDCKANVEKYEKMTERAARTFAELGIAFERIERIPASRVNKISRTLNGDMYLFDKRVTEHTTDDELVKIIKETPEVEYDGYVDYSGNWRSVRWRENPCIHLKNYWKN